MYIQLEIKEAIKWLKERVFCAFKDEKRVRDFECNKDVVIALLRRGEKYEKIWKKLKNNMDLTSPLDLYKTIFLYMNKLEQEEL